MATATLSRTDLSWVESLPELDDEQTGAIRRISNLSMRLKGDWSGMMGFDTVGGEDFGAFRFQLAYMTYALGLAHVHRLPAAPGVFKKSFERLIAKMLLPDVWLYWSNASTGGGPMNKMMGDMERQWDPVAKDNIMYSAYLQSMALMYHYLFRDDRYAQPGGLTMRLETRFWNEGGFTFPYDEKSLNTHIFWQMAEEGFMGVACEPGCIFQICNQPTLIGFRMHDLVYGTDMAEQASKGYLAAWNEFGMFDERGDFTTLMLRFNRSPFTIDSANMHFWLMALLHSWQPEVVESQYPRYRDRYVLDGPAGTKWIEPRLAPFEAPDATHNTFNMAWAACAASEVGDDATRDGLLAYADRFFHPTWEDGGFYYKRHDENFDADGNFIAMDVASGNAMFNYARLNVKDGLKKLYDGPLDDAHFIQPALVDLPDDVDVRRAVYDKKRKALVITLGSLATPRPIVLEVRAPADRPLPVVLQDGVELDGLCRSDVGFTVDLELGTRTTLVFQW